MTDYFDVVSHKLPPLGSDRCSDCGDYLPVDETLKAAHKVSCRAKKRMGELKAEPNTVSRRTLSTEEIAYWALDRLKREVILSFFNQNDTLNEHNPAIDRLIRTMNAIYEKEAVLKQQTEVE